MAKTQFENASRTVAFSFDPEELVLIEDPKHPLYDARVKLPLKPEFIANIAAIGVVEPVIVRRIDGKPVVIDGRQRVRAARVVNVRARKNCETTLKVPVVVRNGDEADAYTVTVSLNEQRQDDPKREKIAKAQRLSQLGRSEGDIALAMGVSVPTVKRMLRAEVKASVPAKRRGKATRPSAKKIQAVIDRAGGEIEPALQWAVGAIGDAEFFARFPMLKPEAKPARALNGSGEHAEAAE